MTVKTFLPGESKRDIRLTTAKAVVGPVCSPLTPGSRPGLGFVRRRPEANPSAFVDGEPLSKTFHERTAKPQVPPLRCAPVGMTRGRDCASKRRFHHLEWAQRPMIPPVSGSEEKFPFRLLTE